MYVRVQDKVVKLWLDYLNSKQLACFVSKSTEWATMEYP